MTDNNPPCFRTEQQVAVDVAQWKSRSDPCEPFYFPMRPSYSALQHFYASYYFGLALQQQAYMRTENPISLDNDSQIVCRWFLPIGRKCGEVFDTPAKLATHLKEAHFSSDTPRICFWKGCDRNGIEFKAKYKLVAHARVHSGEQPFTCKACNKAFARSENLKLHIRMHTGEKPLKCTFGNCEKVFSNSSDRLKHLSVHSAKKRHYCKYAGCDKKYSHPTSLRKHYKNDHQNIGNTSTTSNSDESSESDLSEVGESNKEN